MRDIFNLYINGNLVDFDATPSFPITYQIEDLANPTAVKNSFSKTIKISGTKNNNKIFGEIYNLDRAQLYKFNQNSGVYFDASKRAPFELYKNNELIESGYIQLTDITIKDYNITYNITLYGGLGDFFYSLMYKEDGEKKTLADLYYKVEDANGDVLPKETELNFTINKDFVNNSWESLKTGATGNTINDVVSFAPSYNGLYSDFSNNTFIINTKNSEVFNTDNSKTVDGVEYTTYEGYKLAKVERDFTEWEAQDLRSYMQRPCLKFNKLFNALCDSDNNGGYSVNLDNTFFNENNPYYSKTYMALPLLPSMVEGTEDDVKNYNLYLDNEYYANTAHIGYYNNTLRLNTGYNLAFNGDDLSATASNDFVIDMTNVPITSTFNVSVDFNLNFVAESLNNTMDNENLYLSCMNIEDYWTQEDPEEGWESEHIVNISPIYKSITVQLVMRDAENLNAPKYYSKFLNFTNLMSYNGYGYFFSQPSKWINDNATAQEKEQRNYAYAFGNFKRQGETNNYKFVTDNKQSTFNLNIKDVPRKNKMSISLIVKLMYDRYDSQVTPRFLTNKLANVKSYQEQSQPIEYTVKGYSTLPLNNTSILEWNSNTPTVRSNAPIKKNVLLKTEFSPCDVLLDYCKLFGLYFTKDIHSKTINIMSKNTFYNGNVININNKIDYSQEFKITPYLFETKYYLMKPQDNESYFSKKYKNEYNLSYGQKRIDTNYNFNNETKELFEKSLFQNAITATDTSPYYKTLKNINNLICPSWFLNNPTITLYNGVGGNNAKTTDINYNYNNIVNVGSAVDWNIKSGYDLFAKTCFFNLDNNNKSLSDISSTLLFFNGFKELKDTKNNVLKYWLTDDVYTMSILNDGKMCYLYTESATDYTGGNIAILQNELPQFVRYKTNEDFINESLDFGLPKETYIMPVINYNEDATIYNKFWRNYLVDRYNINTKKVLCNVNLKGLNISTDTLRNFYYFNNSLWVINKIENYNPTSEDTTKVEFVKVNEIENYTEGQQQYYYNNIELSENSATLDYNVTSYNITLTANNNWMAVATNIQNTVSPRSGTQGTHLIEFDFEPNETEDIKTDYFIFSCNGETKDFELKLLPSPKNAKLLYGYVYDENTQTALPGYRIVFNGEKEVTTNEDGYYQLYLGKSLGNIIDVEIYKDDELINIEIVTGVGMQSKEQRNFNLLL